MKPNIWIVWYLTTGDSSFEDEIESKDENVEDMTNLEEKDAIEQDENEEEVKDEDEESQNQDIAEDEENDPFLNINIPKIPKIINPNHKCGSSSSRTCKMIIFMPIIFMSINSSHQYFTLCIKKYCFNLLT